MHMKSIPNVADIEKIFPVLKGDQLRQVELDVILAL